MIRVLLVDDQLCVRVGLEMRLSLEPDLTVVGQAASGLEALELVERLKPDVVLMDVQLPVLDGIQAADALARQAPDCVVVIHSLDDCPELLLRAERAGAFACVSKQAGDVALIATIRAAAEQADRRRAGEE